MEFQQMDFVRYQFHVRLSLTFYIIIFLCVKLTFFFLAFSGMFFTSCYDPDIKNTLLGNNHGGRLHEKTQNSTTHLRSIGYLVVEKWEHDVAKEKKKKILLFRPFK